MSSKELSSRQHRNSGLLLAAWVASSDDRQTGSVVSELPIRHAAAGCPAGRDGSRRGLTFRRAAASIGLLVVSAAFPLDAAADDLSDLKRALRELQEQNSALARRIATLEATQGSQQRQATQTPPVQDRPAAQPLGPRAQPAPGQQARTAGAPSAGATSPASREELEQRVRDLELSRTAQEDATRSIIQSSLAKSGPKINEFLQLSGNIEVLAGNTKDLSGQQQNNILLNTAELDFDIKAGEWATGSLIIAYDPGTSVLFPTNQGNPSGVDRMTVDRAMITVGDPMRFPLYAKVGRDVIPFGSSTGLSRTSGLSIETPLTIQVFENRTNWFGFGFEFPTPALTRPPSPVVVPPVQPKVVGPLVNKFAHWVGFHPPTGRPSSLAPYVPLPEPAPFYGSVNFFQGNDLINSQFDFTQNFNASVGYRATGHCGRPYSELKDSLICPWSFDISADFTSNVYASTFLSSLDQGYGTFMNQIGRVAGIAANLKGSFGPFSLIGEYNTTFSRSTVVDGLGNQLSFQPAAWQGSLGYQFGWNPWVERIGDQGTFVAIGYSGSQGLAGVTSMSSGTPTRVGFVPQSRLIMTASEWVLESVKLTFETSIDWDYPISDGGTGRAANAFGVALSYNF